MHPNWVGGVAFAVIGVACLVGSFISGREAVTGSPLWGALSILLFGLACMMGYEVDALWTRQLPTISFLTDALYVHFPIAWTAAYVGLMYAVGALSLHFTYSSRYHWSVAFIGAASLLAGAATTVITRWLPV